MSRLVIKAKGERGRLKVWHTKGAFTLEAALLAGLMILIIGVLTLALFKSVYKAGLEALFNYADNNFVFQTEAYNLKKGPESQRLQSQLNITEKMVLRSGRSRRQIMNLPFTNVIERSYVGKRLIIGQVMVEFAEQSKTTKTPNASK